MFFGFQILRDIRKNAIDVSFLETSEETTAPGLSDKKGKLYKKHPIVGSILFLASNPYWWLWWSTAGLSIILENSVELGDTSSFLGLVLGKELGVYIWYTFISTAIGFSSRFITKKVYLGILLVCALFMAGYGGYLAISPLFSFL